MGDSVIYTARKNLHDLLAARPNLATVQVTYGPPTAYEEQEVVSLGATEDPTEGPRAVASTQPRAEQFTLVVHIKAHDPTALTGDEVDKRCWELVEEVRDTVADNPTGILSGPQHAAGQPRVISCSSEYGPLPAAWLDGNDTTRLAGWVCLAEVRILCAARITP